MPNLVQNLQKPVAFVRTLSKPIAFELPIGVGGLNLAGYGLLAMFFCSILELAATASLMNPAWEFQAGGRITDASWALVLGMALAFRRDAGQEFPSFELGFLKWLSRACLVAAFGYVLLVALIFNAAGRLARIDQAQARQALERVDRHAEALASAVSSAESVDALQRMLPAWENAGVSLAGKPIEAAKAEMHDKVRTQQRDNTSTLRAELQNRDASRFWLAMRMCAHSLIIGVLSLWLFFRTKEIRA